MLTAPDSFAEARQAVLVRAERTITDATTGEPVARGRRRRIQPTVPDTKLHAIHKALSIVIANDQLLDAAAEMLGEEELARELDGLEAAIAGLDASSALDRFADRSTAFAERVAANPSAPTAEVYELAETAHDLLVFVSVELHLVARMLDSTYEPSDAKALMRLFNQSLPPVFGIGSGRGVFGRYKPWRYMVTHRGLTWP